MSRKSSPDFEGPGVAAEDGTDPAPSPADLKAFALGLLSRREYGEAELAARLERKWPGHPGMREQAAACVRDLAADGLVSDQRFAEAFMRARRRKGQGPLKIRAELQQRRVDDAVIAANVADDDETWARRAFDWLQRHAPRGLGRAERARFYRRLANRGFSHAQAMAALDMLGRDRDGFPSGN